jgi:hypothetical protein
MNFEAHCPIEKDSTVPEIPSPPTDFSIGGIVSWLLLILCGAIAALWRLNESKSATAITALDARLVANELKHEERLKVSMEKHDECEKDRVLIGTKLAVLEDRMKSVENKMVHKAD